MTKYYAGIGSRETPQAIGSKMMAIASRLEVLGYTLRSGGASGADQAFSAGCTNKEIYVPWQGFNGNRMLFEIPDKAYEIASGIHPGWEYISQGGKTLMARNALQILGHDLNTPSDFVICWTKDGCSTESERTNKTGGTGQAIAHASRLGIPVFNMAKSEHYLKFHQFLKSIS